MASDILHIKDSYYFEIPKFMWQSHREKASDFPDWFVRLDDDYQAWEADPILVGLTEIGVSGDDLAPLKARWLAWQHADHKNAAWPLDGYLERQSEVVSKEASAWAKKNPTEANDPLKAFLAVNPRPEIEWFIQLQKDPSQAAKWTEVKAKVNSESHVKEYLNTALAKDWSKEKIFAYNRSLDGKILIPQPFGVPRNAYEAESGLCISKYMILEVAVALIMLFLFNWLAKRIATGAAPTGKRWNLLEGAVQVVRDHVVVPAMGEEDADKFMPFFWTLFFFILGCNLMGMIPWLGSPTASFSVTAALALVVFAIGLVMGVKTFGVAGYLKNICPSLGLPWYLALWVIPLLWLIEFASLFIKHLVLSVRLLMNMGAGHLVLLGILGIGISAQAASMSSVGWGSVATISVLGTTALSVLELFVAFLQAYVFTFLSAMFIGSSMHHH